MAVARELTKLHEEMYRGESGQVLNHFQQKTVKGELVLILNPGTAGPQVSLQEALRRMLSESDLPRREVVKLVAAEYGVSGSEVYKESLKLMKDGSKDE
jgi:16S rRNA (cytidine1402-2'-O)-methyltransferase